MEVYLGPQLPKEREAVGLFPRVSLRSCLQAKVKHETGEMLVVEVTSLVGNCLRKEELTYSVTDLGMGSLSRSIN